VAQKSIGKLTANPSTKFQKLENLNKAIDFCKRERMELVNVDGAAILSGTRTLILGLMWTIILRYQLSAATAATATTATASKSPKQALLAWLRDVTGIETITDFKAFADARVMVRLVNFVADIVGEAQPFPDEEAVVAKDDPVGTTEEAINAATRLFRFPLIIDAQSLASGSPDDLSCMTYMSYFQSLALTVKKTAPVSLPQHVQKPKPPRPSADPAKSAAFGKGLRSATVGQRCAFTVEAFTGLGMRCREGGDEPDVVATYADGEGT